MKYFTLSVINNCKLKQPREINCSSHSHHAVYMSACLTVVLAGMNVNW